MPQLWESCLWVCALVKNIADDAITWMKTEVFADKIYHQILTKNELDDLAERFRAEYLKDLENLLRDLQGRFSSDNELSLYEDFKENMERAESFFFPEGATAGLAMFYDEIDKHIQALGEEDEPSSSDWSEQAAKSANLSATSATENSSTIFDDIDD